MALCSLLGICIFLSFGRCLPAAVVCRDIDSLSRMYGTLLHWPFSCNGSNNPLEVFLSRYPVLSESGSPNQLPVGLPDPEDKYIMLL